MSFQPESPDCLTVRATLDFARPGEEDPEAIDFAQRHARDCPACQVIVSRNAWFDRQFGAACREVPVPLGLKASLLGALEAAADAESRPPTVADGFVAAPALVTVSPAEKSPMTGRRKWMRSIIAVAATSAVAIAAVMIWQLLQPRINLDELGTSLVAGNINPDELPELGSFSGGRSLALPETMVTQFLSGPPREFQRSAVYFFSMPDRRGPPLQGRLIIVPTRWVSRGLPAATRFLGGPVQYKSGYCLTSWVEAEYSYVCCITGSNNELQRLLPSAAVAI